MGIKRYELSEEQWLRIEPLLSGKAGDPGPRDGQPLVRKRLFVGASVWRVLV
jgi:hypothetical protein